MAKYWIKKRFWISLVIVFTVSIVCGFFFFRPYLVNSAKNHFKVGVYEDTSVDYDIPSPTEDQLREIKEMAFVDDVFGYFITEGTLNCESGSVKTKLMLSDMSNVQASLCPSNRQIESLDIEDYPIIFVDSEFAKEYGLSLGDKVTYGSFDIKVAAIVEPDAYKDVQLVLLGKDTDFCEYIKDRANSYSGALLSVNDKTKAEQFLRTYKPLGRLRDEKSFGTEEQYKIHYDAWSEADYSNEITSFEGKLTDIRLSDTNQLFMGIVVYSVAMIAMTVVLFIRKTERVYFKQKKSKRGIAGYYFATMLIEIIVPGMIFVFCGLVLRDNCSNYVADTLFRNTEMLLLLVVIGVGLIDFVLNSILKKVFIE
ncbi:MAG: hypothetical protein IKX68_08165 [Clostridiales bacterium]|nr:hypothetical protein [Clostridiales bacterium]